MRIDAARALAASLVAVAAGCGGGGSPGGSAGGACTGSCVPGAQDFLGEADVQRVIAQAVGEAQARGVRAHIAVVDRVGNVLAVFRMTGAPATVAISSGLGVAGGLDGIAAGTIPAEQAAITKAVTGAYLSSAGNAFSTRTAGQIVQDHFNPGEAHQPSGPLYGVQFSQLSCSDVNRNASHGSIGPKRSPLGLAADPGGLPLYKNGLLVGGVGIESDGLYGIDRDIFDIDESAEEIVAVAAASGFAAPADIRGDRITADGRTFRYVDSEATLADPARAPAFASLPGALLAVSGYVDAAIHAGTAFGSAASGVRADTGALASSGGWILVDAANNNRYPPRDAADGAIRAREAQAMLAAAIAVARRARGQIRRPLGSIAEVSIAIVDTQGDILGFVRTADAPMFGIDVAVQKARTVLFFSGASAEAELAAAPPARYLPGPADASIARYAGAMRDFLGDPSALPGAIAWSARAIGNLHRPTYPDGIEGSPAGPMSTLMGQWSPFNVGFQLDLVYNQLVKGVLGDTSEGCAGRLPAGATPVGADTGIRKLRNGAQIFPGAVPIYRGARMVGAIGVSGDGVDEDDMISSLGLANGAAALASGLGHAPAAMRADTITTHGVRLRYVQCPQAPFNDSSEQNACAGI